jgi:hypothetical protein
MNLATPSSVQKLQIFQDEGYSGAVLVRPGLERLRDLAAEGQIAAVLVYSPDLGIAVRQQILRLLVKEVLVGSNTSRKPVGANASAAARGPRFCTCPTGGRARSAPAAARARPSRLGWGQPSSCVSFTRPSGNTA